MKYIYFSETDLGERCKINLRVLFLIASNFIPNNSGYFT